MLELTKAVADDNGAYPTIRSFESQLWELRDERRITFQELGARMGLSGPYVSHMIRRGPSLRNIEQIAKGFSLRPQHFDVYHVLSFERDVKDGNPLAFQVVQLMIELSRMPAERRAQFMAKTIDRAKRANKARWNGYGSRFSM